MEGLIHATATLFWSSLAVVAVADMSRNLRANWDAIRRALGK
jgi:hypothetical protein